LMVVERKTDQRTVIRTPGAFKKERRVERAKRNPS
jgi:hypothetical protein